VVGGVTANKQVQARDDAMDRLEAIPAYDPLQLEFLDQLQRERRSVESGFTTDFQVATDLNEKMLAGGFSVAETVGANNPALAISLSRQAGQNFQTGINQALGTISTRGLGLTQSIGELINKVAQRRLDLEVTKTSQELGLATSELQTSQTNMAQFAARLPEFVDDFKFVGGQIGSMGGGPIMSEGSSGVLNINMTNPNISTPTLAPPSSLGPNFLFNTDGPRYTG
jgi:hypothetical protein